MKTHQVLVGRLYFFVGSGGLEAQYATASNPLRGSGIILNGHTRASGERECSER